MILFSFLLSGATLAQEKPQNLNLPTGDFSELSRAGVATVAKVIDPQTLQLDDGSLIGVIGLHFPDLQVYTTGDFALTAQKILKDMLEGESVMLYQTKTGDWGRVNRMGHKLMHIERQSDKVWVQGALLALGLAQVKTGQRNPEMAAQMYALETKARASKIGIWEDGHSAVITPEETPEHLNSFQIVEGRVESVATRNNRTYVNFGKDWRTDFTVSITSGDRRRFLKAVVNPMDWGGKTIRVRGWIDEYNGPYIQITHPEAVEILSR